MQIWFWSLVIYIQRLNYIIFTAQAFSKSVKYGQWYHSNKIETWYSLKLKNIILKILLPLGNKPVQLDVTKLK